MPNPRQFTTTSYTREFKWSASEKQIAKKIFQDALRRELDVVVTEARNRMANLKEPSDLWDLEVFLTRRRHEIDTEFDFRYSVLFMVFAVLLRERKISSNELKGLSDEKIEFVRSLARAK
jgi:hypothetical protein